MTEKPELVKTALNLSGELRAMLKEDERIYARCEPTIQMMEDAISSLAGKLQGSQENETRLMALASDLRKSQVTLETQAVQIAALAQKYLDERDAEMEKNRLLGQRTSCG